MLEQGNNALEFLLSEATGERSREVVTITGSAAFSAGTVLGKITATGKYTQHDESASNGTESAVAVLAVDVDATTDARGLVFVRDCEVSDEILIMPDGIESGDRADAIASLAASGVIAR
jgi:hypothetical protein